MSTVFILRAGGGLGARQPRGGEDGVSEGKKGARCVGQSGAGRGPAGAEVARVPRLVAFECFLFADLAVLSREAERERATVCKMEQNLMNLSHCALRIRLRPGLAPLGGCSRREWRKGGRQDPPLQEGRAVSVRITAPRASSSVKQTGGRSSNYQKLFAHRKQKET